MKNHLYIDWLFCVWVFTFWAFIYPHHILYTEQLSLFLYSADFWKPCALQPGGWAAYCGDFLAQFYNYRWTGASIQTLLAVAMLVTSKQILKKMGGRDGILPAAIFPALFLIALQCDHRFTPGHALAFISPYALTLLYMTISNVLLRRVVFTGAMIPIYLFAGAELTFSLFLSCMLYELLYAKGRWKYATPVWLFALIFLPYGWQSVYLMPDDALFNLLNFSLAEDVRYLPLLLLIFIPVCIVVFKVVVKQKWVGSFSFSVVLMLSILGSGYYLLKKSINPLEEQKFAMNRAIAKNQWDRVLKISKRVKIPDQHTIDFTNLALAMKNELPQKMFRYAQTDEILTHQEGYFDFRYGSEFYYRIGLLNEAIRWIFEASASGEKEMDYHILIRLAIWNRENGYEEVAGKYFDILESTLMYRSWAKRRRQMPLPQSEKSATTQEEYYIGLREPIADLALYYRNNPQNRMALDYLLCYLLLHNNLPRFQPLFDMYYLPASKKIPQAYQEALLFLAFMGKAEIRNYPIDPTNEMRFRAFNELVKSRNEAELKRQFGDTWWYYSRKKMMNKD